MRATDTLVMIKPFLNQIPLAARIALVGLAVSVPAPAEVVSFNPPSTSFDTHDDNCNYSNYSGGGSMTGAVTNGGLGVTLSGNDSFQGYSVSGVCHLTMSWQGTGSGAFPGTAKVAANFILTVPADVTITCSLTVFINGIQEAQFDCGKASPGGTFSLPAQVFPVPATLSSYLVQLYIVLPGAAQRRLSRPFP
jgi:hypothetical protein